MKSLSWIVIYKRLCISVNLYVSVYNFKSPTLVNNTNGLKFYLDYILQIFLYKITEYDYMILNILIF